MKRKPAKALPPFCPAPQALGGYRLVLESHALDKRYTALMVVKGKTKVELLCISKFGTVRRARWTDKNTRNFLEAAGFSMNEDGTVQLEW